MSIIEHTVNILVLPGLHSDGRAGAEHVQLDIDSSSVLSLSGAAGPPKPALAIPGLGSLPFSSPLHLKLHLISRLAFNEQGKIVYHRDVVDISDLLRLVPGVQVAQWVGTSMVAQGLSCAVSVAGWAFGSRRKASKVDNDVERGEAASASASAHSIKTEASGVNLNALGLHFSEGSSGSSIFSRTTLFAAPRRTSVSAGRIFQDPPDVDREPHEN